MNATNQPKMAPNTPFEQLKAKKVSASISDVFFSDIVKSDIVSQNPLISVLGFCPKTCGSGGIRTHASEETGA